MSPLRISLCPNGNAINFPDFDSGDDLDVIEEVLLRSGLRRKAAWSSPLEDVRRFGTKTGDVVLRWDGYFTDLERTFALPTIPIVMAGRVPAIHTLRP